MIASLRCSCNYLLLLTFVSTWRYLSDSVRSQTASVSDRTVWFHFGMKNRSHEIRSNGNTFREVCIKFSRDYQFVRVRIFVCSLNRKAYKREISSVKINIWTDLKLNNPLFSFKYVFELWADRLIKIFVSKLSWKRNNH